MVKRNNRFHKNFGVSAFILSFMLLTGAAVAQGIDNRATYLCVDICTGNNGTDGDVYINLHFSSGVRRIRLDKPGYDDFEKGDKDRYYLGQYSASARLPSFTIELKNGDDWHLLGARLVMVTQYQVDDRSNIICTRNVNTELEAGTSTVALR